MRRPSRVARRARPTARAPRAYLAWAPARDGHGPSRRATCRAPLVALRFSPDGRVHACCVNERTSSGRSPTDDREASGRASGPPGARPRRRRLLPRLPGLRLAPPGIGCRPTPSTSTATTRRRRSPGRSGWSSPCPTPATCSASSATASCPRRSGPSGSTGRRSGLAYGDEFFDELPEFLPHVEVAVFIGGEPFLARECRRVWDLLIEMDAPARGPRDHQRHGLGRPGRALPPLAGDERVASPSTGSRRDERRHPARARRLDEVLANRDRFLAATRSYGGDLQAQPLPDGPELAPSSCRSCSTPTRLDVPVYPARVSRARPSTASSTSRPAADVIVATMAGRPRTGGCPLPEPGCLGAAPSPT